jgi:hypothetical protein
LVISMFTLNSDCVIIGGSGSNVMNGKYNCLVFNWLSNLHMRRKIEMVVVKWDIHIGEWEIGASLVKSAKSQFECIGLKVLPFCFYFICYLNANGTLLTIALDSNMWNYRPRIMLSGIVLIVNYDQSKAEKSMVTITPS